MHVEAGEEGREDEEVSSTSSSSTSSKGIAVCSGKNHTLEGGINRNRDESWGTTIETKRGP